MNASKTQWTLKVRVVRLYEIPCLKDKSETSSIAIEMIFIDEHIFFPYKFIFNYLYEFPSNL